jgi:hypothetical protein
MSAIILTAPKAIAAMYTAMQRAATIEDIFDGLPETPMVFPS